MRVADLEGSLKLRTKGLALTVIRIASGLPRNEVGSVLAKQFVRSGTSVGANYRSACRAKSDTDMIAKLAIVEEEADECQYWLELLAESNVGPISEYESMRKELDEIIAIIVTSRRTLTTRVNAQGNQKR
jgi:four helix bundle protein